MYLTASKCEGKWVFTFDKVGRWWSNNKEIDIVAFDSTGMDIIFGECKYWTGVVGVNVLTELEEKAKSVAWKREHRKEHFILFSINGFTEELVELAKTRGDRRSFRHCPFFLDLITVL